MTETVVLVIGSLCLATGFFAGWLFGLYEERTRARS